MTKSKMLVGLLVAVVLLLCTARLASAWIPLNGPVTVQAGSQQEAKLVATPMREPIRVGGNVQESKLVHKVEPVYPEAAKNARVSGVVILQVTINEAGEVYEIRVLRAHPLLDEPAVEAVKQWRYSPTYLNGEAVPVIATVTVIFNLRPQLSVVLDEVGHLSDPASQLEGGDLVQKIKGSLDGVILQPLASVPMSIIEATVSSLQKEGVRSVGVEGFVESDGRLYAAVQYGAEATAGGTSPPVLALDNESLVGIAKSSGLASELPPEQKPLIYRIFMNELGEIVSIVRVRGPKIPALENELMDTRVVSPAIRGPEAVPAVFLITVAVP